MHDHLRGYVDDRVHENENIFFPYGHVNDHLRGYVDDRVRRHVSVLYGYDDYVRHDYVYVFRDDDGGLRDDGGHR